MKAVCLKRDCAKALATRSCLELIFVNIEDPLVGSFLRTCMSEGALVAHDLLLGLVNLSVRVE